ncbi:NADP-dependent malic enzyme [Patescibacteria group bacterium]|nr:NADP-dependent malic enzyme [Patescibacteria group bacterium]
MNKAEVLQAHKNKRGKISIITKMKINNRKQLSIAYTPGVAEVSLAIAKNKNKALDYTNKANQVAIISDGTAVLGLGNIGPEAAMPVMEGKSVLFKELAGVDAFPLCLATQDTEKIIETVKALAPNFAAINLEDISAPRCFEIEQRLIKELDIPVFHDDQHGTAVVVLAGLINSLKLVKKEEKKIKVVISGAGAAGLAIAKLLFTFGVKNILVVDSQGILNNSRKDLNIYKQEVALYNKQNISGGLKEALVGSDVFVGVSQAKIVSKEMIKTMAKDAIVFAMANPIPEIMPELAKSAGAKIVGTGRSDFANQINNALVFPGLFRGLLDSKKKIVTDKMKINVAKAIAKSAGQISPEKIIPNLLDKKVVKEIVQAVKNS